MNSMNGRPKALRYTLSEVNMSAEEDALKTINELNELSVLIERTQAEQKLIEESLIQLDKGEQIDEISLKKLGISRTTPTVLKLRLKGILSTKKANLSSYRSSQKNSWDLLDDLLKCPVCGGLGLKSLLSYNRSDGKVTPVLNAETCTICGGSGKAKFSPRILNLVKHAHS